jgi:hypothetical protein
VEPADVTRAIDAAVSIAVALDLPAEDATVLHNSNKLAVRLTPCDVLARVAHEGQEVAQFEVELAQQLAEVGCPAGTLEPRVEPLVYLDRGFAVTLWTYYEPATAEVAPADYASALERLHVGMRKLDVSSPSFTDRVGRRRSSLPARISRRSSRTQIATSSAARSEICDERSATATSGSSCSTVSRTRATCSARSTGRCSSISRRAVVDPSSSTSPTFRRRSASTTRASTRNC